MAEVGRRSRFCVAAVASLLLLLAFAGSAAAAESLYWDNAEAGVPAAEQFGWMNLATGFGGSLSAGSLSLENPSGMAYDSATGRLYVADSDHSRIVWIAVDGSGSGVLDVGAAPIEFPEGIAIDPRTQTAYWANSGEIDSIGWARLDGSGGGQLNTSGTVKLLANPHALTIDVAKERVYWAVGNGGEGAIEWASLAGTGGAELGLPNPAIGEPAGLAIDEAAERIYWLSKHPDIEGLDLDSADQAAVDHTGAPMNEAMGQMAFDPGSGRFYWANFEATTPTDGFGTTTLAPGGAHGITPNAAPVDGPRDVLVLKSPEGTSAPQVTLAGLTLTCSQGAWAGDSPGSSIYRAPMNFAYQWTLNGQPLSGATGPVTQATVSGSYACTVTASNPQGSASQTSAPAPISLAPGATLPPPLLNLIYPPRKLVTVRAGQAATLPIGLLNAATTDSRPITVCGARPSKRAKRDLVAPPCDKVGVVKAGRKASAKLRVKTRKSAIGLYELRVRAKGFGVAPIMVRLKVLPSAR